MFPRVFVSPLYQRIAEKAEADYAIPGTTRTRPMLSGWSMVQMESKPSRSAFTARSNTWCTSATP